MRVIARKTLKAFWAQPRYKAAEAPLRAWFAEARRAAWKSPQEVKDQYRQASVIGNGRIVFNIGGNKYRLITKIRFDLGIVFVRFVGTHEQYDQVNAAEV